MHGGFPEKHGLLQRGWMMAGIANDGLFGTLPEVGRLTAETRGQSSLFSVCGSAHKYAQYCFFNSANHSGCVFWCDVRCGSIKSQISTPLPPYRNAAYQQTFILSSFALFLILAFCHFRTQELAKMSKRRFFSSSVFSLVVGLQDFLRATRTTLLSSPLSSITTL